MWSWLRRISREWGVIVAALVGAAFAIGDGAGWIEYLFGHEPAQEWVVFGVFILFAVIVIVRLVKLQTQIDETQDKIRLKASPGSLAINLPLASEPALMPDEVSINTTIHLEIWADTDIHTASLVLNVVGVRRIRWRRFWYVFLPKSKRMLGIRIDGQDTPVYRKQIKHTDAQPFEDNATFKWRGKRETIDWGDTFLLELALDTGSPKGTWRVTVDPRLHERGATTAL